MEANVLLEMKKIDKQFAGVHALSQVDFSVKQGEIHALMGENGAGKSTLIKVLTGLYSKDSGSIYFDGKEVSFKSPEESQKNGISTIYQEVNLIPYLSVAENIFIGHELHNKFGIDWKSINIAAEKMMHESGIDIDVTEPLNTYSTAVQQMVAITRAIYINAKLVIMDEPTSSLTDDEVEVLFNKMRKLKADGISIIFISHKLDELFKICDRVSILKDGKFVGCYDMDKITKLEMVSKMIGRDAANVLKRRVTESNADGNSDPLVSAEDIRDAAKLRGVSLNIRAGEVVGLSGLLGAGKTEFAKALFGCDYGYEGEFKVNGNHVELKSAKEAIDYNFAYCSESRKEEGIFPHMSVKENITIAVLPQISKGGIVNAKAQKNVVDDYIKKIQIKTPSMDQEIRNLSGGNQQKVLLARWLCMNPKLIILDEPTRGIDVGAKAEIEDLIQQFSADGIGVLYISSEIEELVRNCHRVIVIHNGKSVKELAGDRINEKNILGAIADNNVN